MNKKAAIERLRAGIEHHMRYALCRPVAKADKSHLFMALALAVRDFAMDGMFKTMQNYDQKNAKRVYYLSVEYLIGRSLENNLQNLGLYDLLDDVKLDTKIPLRSVLDMEYDPALGNGGLGRLAACFLDSMATLGIPGYGYGINYQFGLFKQYFENGYQKERADSWLDIPSPWQVERWDRVCKVPLYGRIVYENDGDKQIPRWVDYEIMIGVPYDMPVVGYGAKTVNYLRLFSAHSSDVLDMKTFNEGGYIKAVEKKILSETVSKVLYPSDAVEAGKELRLVQQYFFVACSIHDIIRRFLAQNSDFTKLPEKAVIQMNDTHPSLAVAELMRVLMDNYGLPFEQAFDITQNTLAFTNHTLLPEAIEKWPVEILERILPRHLRIIYDINQHMLNQVSEKWPNDFAKLQRMSLIEEGGRKQVRMGNLAIYGSRSVNGVAQLHSELIKTKLAPDFYEWTPKKFNNKTNGITPRRWLLDSNHALSDLISELIGREWITDLNDLRRLEPFIEQDEVLERFMEAKKANKELLAKIINEKTGVIVDTNSIFDAQVKRMHEYKRQLLNVLNILHQYLTIVEDGQDLPSLKTYVFAGKAAPSYDMAKLIIKLINNMAQVINNDPKVKGQLRITLIPDYKVSLAERIFPASDVSEQISTAGFEASGTGNMKFALNGALTIGTLDGANIEIREEVGKENFYLFGLTADEVTEQHKDGTHRPWDYYNGDFRIKRVMDMLSSNRLCPDEPELFKPIFQNIMYSDYYMLLADFASYVEQQDRISHDYADRKLWAKKAFLNVARVGKFSSDRTIAEYAKDIWKV